MGHFTQLSLSPFSFQDIFQFGPIYIEKAFWHFPTFKFYECKWVATEELCNMCITEDILLKYQNWEFNDRLSKC